MSDIAAVYGLPAGYLDPPSPWERFRCWLRGRQPESRYLRYLRLLLNVDRQRMTWAVAVLRGVVAAEPVELEPAWGDALASDESEADSILSRSNSARAAERARRKMGL